VLVTGVSPGPVKTERWDNLMVQQAHAAGQDLETYVRERSQELPLGRIAVPEEVADVVCFLASQRASFLTGITITIDGGITRGVYL
jgi:3-oxoacyl-[acyl-carrier protein] reductase